MQMETVNFSEMLINFYLTARHNCQNTALFRNDSHENFNSGNY